MDVADLLDALWPPVGAFQDHGGSHRGVSPKVHPGVRERCDGILNSRLGGRDKQGGDARPWGTGITERRD